MKRRFSMVLAFLLIFSMAFGCATGYAETEKHATEEGFELPIVTEPFTITIWAPAGDTIYKTMSNLGESEYFKEMERRTGIHVEFIHPTMGSEAESLNLLLASDQLPDIINPPWGWNYATGYDGGVADGLFLDINDIVKEYCPNYWKALNMSEEIWRESVTDSGKIAGFWNICVNGAQPPFMGEVVRQDWLDELGIPTPVTYDDWHDMLVAFKEKKGAVAPMMLYYTGFDPQNVFCGGYGITETFFMKDGQVKYGPLEDGYRAYLDMLSQWYAEGLIDPDFVTKKEFLPAQEYTISDKTGSFYEQYLDLNLLKTRSDNPNYQLSAVPTPRVNKDDDLHVRQTGFEVGNSVWIITADCKDPVTVAKWCDYAFTREGDLLASYGFEGKTWEYDENGNPAFTEFMYNNPDGLSLAEAYNYYAKLGGAGYYHWDREFAGMVQSDLDAMTIWATDNDGAYVMPMTVTMNADEAVEFANIMADIETYRSEMVINFILGIEPIENYDNLVATLKDMNIDRALEIKQASLDRFLAR